MYFDSIDAFLQMGKHGIYVWSAYGISLALIGLNIVIALKAHSVACEDVRRVIRRELSEARGKNESCS